MLESRARSNKRIWFFDVEQNAKQREICLNANIKSMSSFPSSALVEQEFFNSFVRLLPSNCNFQFCHVGGYFLRIFPLQYLTSHRSRPLSSYQFLSYPRDMWKETMKAKNSASQLIRTRSELKWQDLRECWNELRTIKHFSVWRWRSSSHLKVLKEGKLLGAVRCEHMMEVSPHNYLSTSLSFQTFRSCLGELHRCKLLKNSCSFISPVLFFRRSLASLYYFHFNPFYTLIKTLTLERLSWWLIIREATAWRISISWEHSTANFSCSPKFHYPHFCWNFHASVYRNALARASTDTIAFITVFLRIISSIDKR